MDVPVPTKLLNAELNESAPDYPLRNKHCRAFNVLEPEKITTTKQTWRSVSARFSHEKILTAGDFRSFLVENKYMLRNEGPSRFDLPEVEELMLGLFSSFDDITYHTEPIVQAQKSVRNLDVNASFHDTDMMETFGDRQNCVIKQNKKYAKIGNRFLSEKTEKRKSMEYSRIKKFQQDCNKYKNNDSLRSSIRIVDSVDNHVKIIREVLRKYPYLVQRNKNIRLKIVQKESRNSISLLPVRTKVSYLVFELKSLMTDGPGDIISAKMIKDSGLKIDENRHWECEKCNEEYTNYKMFKLHIKNIHNEHLDAKLCEHCGFRAPEGGILMRHMYTKHDVVPVKYRAFPKSQVCSYIPLVKTLQIKDQINHKHWTFREGSQYQKVDSVDYLHPENHIVDSHELSLDVARYDELRFHTDKNKSNCPHCKKYFSNSVYLQIHLESNHANLGGPKFSLKTSAQCRLFENNFSCSNFNTDTYPSEEKKLQPAKLLDKFPRKQTTQDETTSNMEMNESQTNLLFNDEKRDAELFFKINTAEADKGIFENPEKKWIKTSEDNESGNYTRKSYSDLRRRNRLGSWNNDEIIEDVVEELETIEYNKRSHNNKLEKNQCEKNDKTNESNNDIFDSAKISGNHNGLVNVIQYVEEETEILEYDETFTNI